MPLRRLSRPVREAAPGSGCRVTGHQGGNDVNADDTPLPNPDRTAVVFPGLSYCTPNRDGSEDDGPAVRPFGHRIPYRETGLEGRAAERWTATASNDGKNRHIRPNTRGGTGPAADSSRETEAGKKREEDASHG